MFIKKIEIENIKAFDNKVTIDLNHTRNDISSELDDQFIKEVDDQFLVPIVSIGGTNASGKTSIIVAVKFLLDYLNVYVDLDKHLNQIFLILKNNGISNFDDQVIKRISLYLKEKSKETFTNLSCDDNKIIELATDLFIDSKSNKFLSSDSAIKILNEIHNWIYNYKVNVWTNDFKRFKNKASSIAVTLYDKNYGEFTVLIHDFVIDKKVHDISIVISSTINKLHLDNLFEDYLKYIKSNFFYTNELEKESLNSSDSIDGFQMSLVNLYKTYGEKLALKILNICDDSIKNIIILNVDDPYNKDKYYLKSLLSWNWLEIDPNFLSDGTKKFICILDKILTIVKSNKSGLIMIDDIEDHLNNELINFIKMFLYQSTNNHVQLIYTSHNSLVLSSLISINQIYLITNDDNDFNKVINIASSIDKNDSIFKLLIEKKIGLNPRENDILNICNELAFLKSK